MTATQPGRPSTEGVRSLEVRWILPGQLAVTVARWFGRFPAQTNALEDVYLLDPHLPGLSVKVREGQALEVKVYGGSPGLLVVAGRARGRLESWQKWSFAHGPPSYRGGDRLCWQPVRKRRRIIWFSLADDPGGARDPGRGQGPGCAVELTQVHAGGQAWWTLGFEATGPASLLHSELEAAAAAVFAQARPMGWNWPSMTPRPTHSGYASGPMPEAPPRPESQRWRQSRGRAKAPQVDDLRAHHPSRRTVVAAANIRQGSLRWTDYLTVSGRVSFRPKRTPPPLFAPLPGDRWPLGRSQSPAGVSARASGWASAGGGRCRASACSRSQAP